MAKSTIAKLYWVSTADGAEDWFVVARSARDARVFHEDQEGYERGDAASRLVCRVPEEAQHLLENVPGWPSNEVIEACGGVFPQVQHMLSPADEALSEMMGTGGRVVEMAGQVFAEGHVVKTARLAVARKRSHEDDPTRGG
jgi:hypothetical protein